MIKASADLTERVGVLSLMASSMGPDEWNSNADAVKQANGGDYPEFWFSLIVKSGVARRVMEDWGREPGKPLIQVEMLK